jgi:hypothetical protein
MAGENAALKELEKQWAKIPGGTAGRGEGGAALLQTVPKENAQTTR